MKKRRDKGAEETTISLLQDLLIAELGKADVPQQEIRKIVGCEMRRVTRIVKHMKKEK